MQMESNVLMFILNGKEKINCNIIVIIILKMKKEANNIGKMLIINGKKLKENVVIPKQSHAGVTITQGFGFGASWLRPFLTELETEPELAKRRSRSQNKC